MKTTTILKRLMVLLLGMISYIGMAQNYNLTLVQNSDYNFTIAAVAQFDSGSFQPITQSYGFVLVLPDGITITVDQALPSGTNETVTAIPGTNVSGLDPSMADKDLFLITTDTGGGTLATHGNGAVIPLVTITVNGSPTSGEIRILDNSSTLASHPAINGSLDAFIQADITDDSTVNFTNEFNVLSGLEAFNFSTLSVETIEEEALNVALYPNPAKDEVQIKATGVHIEKVEVFDINGKQVLQIDNPLSKLDISTLESAMYLVKLYSDNGFSKTIKLMKD